MAFGFVGSLYCKGTGADYCTRRRRGAVCVGLMDKQIWVKPAGKDVVTAAVENGISTLVFTDDKSIEEAGQLVRVSFGRIQDEFLYCPDGRVGPVVHVDSADSQQQAMDLAGKSDLVAIVANDWRIIPAENLVAKFQATKTQVFAFVGTVLEAEVMLTTLEVGVDGVILETGDPNEARALGRLSTSSSSTIELTEFVVSSVKPIGMGDRVCVDTCSLLGEKEGMMVGSSSQRMVLVLSEAAKSEYVPSRPFRVNAGTVSAYCMLPGGRTKYLAEQTMGSSALAVSADGTTREVVVGRSKIERRPLVLVEFSESSSGSNRTHGVILQNAETVRLASPDQAEGLSVTSMKPGDRILGSVDNSARHVGMKINESILET
eukprot:CAMPEP_0113962874 /NCGR_PEP_ID=MMETSP0011_2-20120614/6186_1 /TAXON_ID=101924 /ORGANISM="Rhodosorus marinus" /LENGTH=374 /DNA_ID=CAMNT_0000974833 /DNA_START=1672 /DNA_END=2796 /DNA_ORIENTATION=+ /assembly_acc=CAM_ASM_000156